MKADFLVSQPRLEEIAEYKAPPTLIYPHHLITHHP